MKRFLMLFLGLSLVFGFVAIAEDFEVIKEKEKDKDKEHILDKNLRRETTRVERGIDIKELSNLWNKRREGLNDIMGERARLKPSLVRRIIAPNNDIEIEIIFKDIFDNNSYPQGLFDVYTWVTQICLGQTSHIKSYGPCDVKVGEFPSPNNPNPNNTQKAFKMAGDYFENGQLKWAQGSYIPAYIMWTSDNSLLDHDPRKGIVRLIIRQQNSNMPIPVMGIINLRYDLTNQNFFTDEVTEFSGFLADSQNSNDTQQIVVTPLFIKQGNPGKLIDPNK